MDEFDGVIEPMVESHKVNYMIPRVYFCQSKLFLKLINDFGNEGGFDMLLDVLENG